MPDAAPILNDLAYGPHARHRLDVYAPPGAVGAPVLVFFHGGGFIRGDKGMRANVGAWGASQGFVTALANYRLAPECRWPSGPEDVVAVWRAVRAQARDWGGDSDRIVLVGESAGAAHVAAAALMTRFQPHDWRLSGAALLSGPYNAGLEALAPQALGIEQPDVRNNAYFGDDPTQWSKASIVDQVDAAPLPLLIAAAERDLRQMQVQAGDLFARLVTKHGFSPELHWWAGHDHFTPGASLGSDDTTVDEPLAAFVRRCTGG
ncbi:alpha/beta hydrolase [Hydrogenophaga luteola]|uniref:Alpha/beta hydrolase n=1 Tax=Hydrogenophaga luteola TaxID=1591122 RepID=A0ABV7W393_9BURK